MPGNFYSVNQIDCLFESTFINLVCSPMIFFHAFASFEEAPVANHFDHHSDILNSPFFSSNILLSLKFLVFFVKSNYEISRN